jgi:aerobic carbon-monoxide dehydrogenase medium subunit
MILAPFDYVECADVEQAISILHKTGEGARVIAGGTALVPLMKHRIAAADVLVGVSRITALRRVEVVADGSLLVGSCATHRAVSQAPAVRGHSPLLADACGRVASPPIRAMGTLGGNLCYGESASDPSPALIALGAEIILHGAAGRRRLAVEDLFTGFYETALAPGEVLEAIVVPGQTARRRWRYLKWTPRAREDKPLVGLAVVIDVESQGRARVCREVRLGLGGVHPFPLRLRAAERVLAGAEASRDVVREAADAAAAEVQPFEDLQASADYRREMTRVWVRRIVSELLEVS